MKYNNHQSYKKRKRFLLKVRLVFVLLLAPVLLGLYIIYNDFIIDNSSSQEKSATSQPTRSYVAPKVSIFKTPYFQFQADQSWVEVPAESSPSKFLYRSLRSNLIEHELVIYVDQIPANLSSSRILPAQFKKGMTELVPLVVSEHCMKVVPELQRSSIVSVALMQVQFNCDADTTSYSILLGAVNGSSSIKMQRPDSSISTYSILYTNLKASPEPSQIQMISSSFQTR